MSMVYWIQVLSFSLRHGVGHEDSSKKGVAYRIRVGGIKYRAKNLLGTTVYSYHHDIYSSVATIL